LNNRVFFTSPQSSPKRRGSFFSFSSIGEGRDEVEMRFIGFFYSFVVNKNE